MKQKLYVYKSIFTALTLVCAMSLFADDGSWISTTSGQWWSGSDRWADGVIADGTDHTAWFTNDISGSTFTVALSPSRTLGHLYFNDAVGQTIWILKPATGDQVLTLETTSGLPTITVNESADVAYINCELNGMQGFEKLGTGKVVIGTDGKVNDYTGDTVISEGQLWLGGQGTPGTGAVSYGIPDSSVISFNNEASARFTMNGFNATIGGLSTSGGAGLKIVEAAYDNGVNKPATLTLNVADGVTADYGDFIRDGGDAATILSVVKTGSGTQNFSCGIAGRMQYSGTTTVSEGTLLFDGKAGSITNRITVEAGAALGGTGLVGGDVYFEEGSKFHFNPTSPLTVYGDEVTLEQFDIADVSGLDETVDYGTYPLIEGLQSNTVINVDHLNNFGASAAATIGDRSKTAYFQLSSASELQILQIVVSEKEPALLSITSSVSDTAVISAENMDAGVTNFLQYKEDLMSEMAWSNVSFVIGVSATNWNVDTPDNQGFFRIDPVYGSQ
jgi:autotransporter-associated beta strand protein